MKIADAQFRALEVGNAAAVGGEGRVGGVGDLESPGLEEESSQPFLGVGRAQACSREEGGDGDDDEGSDPGYG